MASLSQGRTAAAQCGLFTHKSVPVIFEPPCTYPYVYITVSEMSHNHMRFSQFKNRFQNLKKGINQRKEIFVTQ